MTDLAVLTEGELRRLDEAEDRIERGLSTFLEVGSELIVIRDGRLYRSEYATFEDYCQKRWGISDSRARQLMGAARTVTTVTASGLPPPENEAQARELARVPEEQRADVWQQTMERTNGKPTAAAIRETYEPEPDPLPAPIAGEIERRIAERTRPAREPVMLTLRTHTGAEVPYPKPQAKPTFNETSGEGISWAAWSWNPVTGCLHGCDYCYARAIIHRYPDANPAGFTPLFHEERLDAPANTTIPAARRDDPAYRRVFVCSMADLYGRWVPDEWISRVHASMLDEPNWEYLLLTKFPDRYVGLDLPPSAWVGTSVDEQKRVRIAERAFRKIEGVKVKWLSLEPLTEPLEFDDLSMFDWVVIGAQTATVQPDGPVEAFAPHYDWVQRITEQARAAGCRVHHKPNLTNGRPGMRMLNEYPDGTS